VETTSILWIQKISFAQFCPADVGFWCFAQPGFNRGNHMWVKVAIPGWNCTLTTWFVGLLASSICRCPGIVGMNEYANVFFGSKYQ